MKYWLKDGVIEDTEDRAIISIGANEDSDDEENRDMKEHEV